jgi:hypothetical protein
MQNLGFEPQRVISILERTLRYSLSGGKEIEAGTIFLIF